MKINDYFSTIFCLNLERRKDRRQQAEAEFLKHGITNVQYIYGVDGKTLNIPPMLSMDGSIVSCGDIGCSMSHLLIAELAKNSGITKYLVFEDDVEFMDGFNEDTLLESFMRYVPKEADALWFGGNHDGGFTMVEHNIAKIHRTFTTHCYAALTPQFIDGIIKVLSPKDEKVDVAIGKLHSKFNCYAVRPSLAFQRDSFSDILNREVSYKHLKQ